LRSSRARRRRFTFAADNIRSRYYAATQVNYLYDYDPLGNYLQRESAGEYNPGGQLVIDTALYDAYGSQNSDTLSSSGTVANNSSIGFGGQWGNYTDSETGLLCLGHRYYDPGTGRFLNRDPIGYAGGENLYGYAGNNPINEADPEGTQGAYEAAPEPSESVETPDEIKIEKENEKLPRGTRPWTEADEKAAEAYSGARDNLEKKAEAFDREMWRDDNGWRDPKGKFVSPLTPVRPGISAEVTAKPLILAANPGSTLIGTQVGVRNAQGQLRYYDYVIKDEDGVDEGIDVKSGTASLTKSQREFDEGVSKDSPALGVGRYDLQVAVQRTSVFRMPKR
jgi:RHS repeat-associated protein